ncbi:hypothetical protein MWU59_11800 [Flavobacteriaceae bacterium F08102]|nr:hypothetical protein [Flavobacteriaceae bacterium F08102]
MDSTKKHYLFHRERWSQNQFSWFHGGILYLTCIVFALILRLFGIYQSTPFRAINGVFVIGAMFFVIWDYQHVKDTPLLLIDSFFMCLRTGFYFCVLFIPTIILFFLSNQADLAVAKTTETNGSSMTILEIALSSGFEYMAATALFGLIASSSSVHSNTNKLHH